jgi:hypothetical protein
MATLDIFHAACSRIRQNAGWSARILEKPVCSRIRQNAGWSARILAHAATAPVMLRWTDLKSVLPALVMAVLVPLTGCRANHPYGEVEGMVTLEGQPLANVEVVFLPDPEKGNTGRRSVALTDAQGRYQLASDAGQEGAPVGFHRVCINDLLAGPPGVAVPAPLVEQGAKPAGAPNPAAQPPKESRSRFPPDYGSSVSTPFRAIQIKPGSQRIDLDVKRKLPR